jgi:hypothetical protein
MYSGSNLILEKKEYDKSDIKLILYKISQDWFRMGLGHGMSPFQAFCTVVVWF